MAYTIAIKDTVSPNDVNVSIHELGADFNQSNYIRVIWSSTPIAAQGQSTPPANILCSVNAPASGTSRRVDSGFTLGSPASTHIVNGVIYGTAQAANGAYYTAGQDMYSFPLEVSGRVHESPSGALLLDLVVDGLSYAFKLSNYTSVLWSFDEVVQGGTNPPSQIIAGNGPGDLPPISVNPNSAASVVPAEIEESDIGRTVYCSVLTPKDGKYWRAGSWVIQ